MDGQDRRVLALVARARRAGQAMVTSDARDLERLGAGLRLVVV